PALLCRAACRVTLNYIQFRQGRVFFRAVRQLAGQPSILQHSLSPGQLPRLPGSFPRPGGLNGLLYDLPRYGRVLFKIGRKRVIGNRFDDSLDFTVAEFHFGLPLELGIRELYADYSCEPFPDVVAGDALFALLYDSRGCGIAV